MCAEEPSLLDIVADSHLRIFRYLAIRWSDAAQRKKGEKNPATDEALGNWDAVAKQRPQQLIRKDKTFASYVIGELEVRTNGSDEKPSQS